jgi:hypothetical protein
MTALELHRIYQVERLQVLLLVATSPLSSQHRPKLRSTIPLADKGRLVFLYVCASALASGAFSLALPQLPDGLMRVGILLIVLASTYLAAAPAGAATRSQLLALFRWFAIAISPAFIGKPH